MRNKFLIMSLLPFSVMAGNVETQNGKKDLNEKVAEEIGVLEDHSLSERLFYEEWSDKNPFSLTAHKMNYILPYTYAENVNRSVYDGVDQYGLADGLRNEEAKMQLSIKIPVVKNIFNETDKIYFGFTMKSFWQIYSKEISRPFRNTDYNPEIFYMTDFKIKEDQNNFFMLGMEHESNGQFQHLSRSWNRVYTGLARDTKDYAIGLKLWHRLEEETKTEQFAPEGDDNPDIIDFYGNFELTGLIKHGENQYSALTRYNFKTGKGYLEVGTTFPLYGKFKGYVQYVEGYGETLLDYNQYQRRLGIGVVISGIL